MPRRPRRCRSRRAPAQEAPVAPPRAPTYGRRIGEVEVTTLLDGHFLLEQAWVTGLDPAIVAAELEAAYLDPAAAVPLPITGLLVRAGGDVTLVDAGASGSLGPTAGHLAAALAGAGAAPKDVTRLVLTHLHPDHIGGMMADDAPAFPNASVHVNEVELAFWTDKANASAVPEAIQAWFDLAGTVVTAYGDRIITHAGEADLGGGLSAVPMPGHTPGHVGFRIASGDAQLLAWGDTTAVASVQFEHPGAGIVFDTDGALAERTRRRVLDMASADRMLVVGTHMPFPGFGHVERRGEAYAWVPEEWRLL